jgi:hypothetical protein
MQRKPAQSKIMTTPQPENYKMNIAAKKENLWVELSRRHLLETIFRVFLSIGAKSRLIEISGVLFAVLESRAR